jgi:hypothetical protein
MCKQVKIGGNQLCMAFESDKIVVGIQILAVTMLTHDQVYI